MKRVLLGLALGYAVIGTLCGAMLHRAMPAVNLLGATYYGATWLAWPIEHALGTHAMPIPDWAFTFEKDSSK